MTFVFACACRLVHAERVPTIKCDCQNMRGQGRDNCTYTLAYHCHEARVRQHVGNMYMLHLAPSASHHHLPMFDEAMFDEALVMYSPFAAQHRERRHRKVSHSMSTTPQHVVTLVNPHAHINQESQLGAQLGAQHSESAAGIKLCLQVCAKLSHANPENTVHLV